MVRFLQYKLFFLFRSVRLSNSLYSWSTYAESLRVGWHDVSCERVKLYRGWSIFSEISNTG
jgi:hypothetical protein